MGFRRRILLAASVGYFLGCGQTEVPDPTAEYVGAWSNTWAGGDLRIDVEREGERLVFRATAVSNGAAIVTNSAVVEGGYLRVYNGGFFETMAYRKADDALHALNNQTPIAAFKRIRATN